MNCDSVNTVPSTPAPQPTIQFQSSAVITASQRSQGAVYSLTSCYLVPASSSRSGLLLGGIAAAVLVVTMAIVILLTISTYVYCTTVLKKRKGKYAETKDSQLAVISYHVGSKDEVVVSYEEPPDDISPKTLLNHTASSSERSYRESFRNRVVNLLYQENE